MKKDSIVLPTKPLQANSNTFQGTYNLRELRALNALVERPHWREELDRIAGCSNSPALIFRLKELGLDIRCDTQTVIDRDGRKCQSGIYSLTPSAKHQVENWLMRRGEPT